MSNALYDSVAQVLEVDEVGFDTEFRQVPGWCSLQAFGLLVLMENDWNAPLDLVRLRAIRSATCTAKRFWRSLPRCSAWRARSSRRTPHTAPFPHGTA